MASIDRMTKTIRWVAAANGLAAAIYVMPIVLDRSSQVALADDVAPNGGPIEVITSPALRNSNGATGWVEVIESPHANKTTSIKTDKPPPGSAPTPLVVNAPAQSVPLTEPAADPGLPDASATTSEAASSAPPSVITKRNYFDPRNSAPAPKVPPTARTIPRTHSPSRHLPTLAELEGDKPTNTSATNKRSDAQSSAPIAMAPDSPPRSAAVESLPPDDGAHAALHNEPPDSAHERMQSDEAVPPTASSSTAADADADDDPSVIATLKRYLPDWLERMPADLALIGVLALCVVLGLIGAGIRHSRETYD